MNIEQALKALAIADALLTAGFAAYSRARELIERARSEGRDITDAELDALRSDRNEALERFRQQIGG